MSLLLVVIPKHPESIGDDTPRNLRKVLADSAERFVGPRYSSAPETFFDMSADGAFVSIWKAEDETDTFIMRKGRWALSSSPNTASRLLVSMVSQAGYFRYANPVWGSYMAVVGDRSTDRFFAWNTVPTLEAVHYGEDEEFVFISNRPLLIALGIARGDCNSVRLDRNYIREYLNVGYSVSNLTPFEGVRVLPPRASLSVVGGVIGLGVEPKTPEVQLADHADPRRTGAKELAAAFNAAVDRGLARRSSDNIQLRLSGGLDSRIVLGLLRDRDGVSITAVTQGASDSEDVMVASELARVAGVEHVVKHPEFVDRAGFIDSLERSIFESQGYIPSESLVAPYSNASPLSSTEMLVSGQWPLFKGVMDKTMANGLDYVRDKIMATNHNILTEEHNELTNRAITEWLATVPAATNMEILYAHARDLRSSRYLQPHVIQADRASQVFYPFTDSQVAAVADVLPTRNRVQNIAAFLAGSAIWEDGMRVPMAREGYFRFEANEPLDGISGPYFDERRAEIKPYTGPVIRDADTELQMEHYLSDPLQASSQYLVRSPRWPVVSEYLGTDLRNKIYELAKMRRGESTQRHQKKASRKMLTLHCWRAVLVDLWLKRGWLAMADKPAEQAS